MAVVWRDIEISWDGKDYRVRPDYQFIQHVERVPGRSLNQLLVRGSNGDMPSGAAAGLLADTINWAAGANICTPEEIFASAYSDGSVPDLIRAATEIVVACLPAPKMSEADKKKPTASSAKRKKP